VVLHLLRREHTAVIASALLIRRRQELQIEFLDALVREAGTLYRFDRCIVDS
jgi:hypothetical protein